MRKPRKDIGIPRIKHGSTTLCEVCLRSVYSYPSQPRKFCGTNCRDISKILERHDVPRQLKHCAKCQQWKGFDLFVKQLGAPFGLHSYCKECTSTWFHDFRGTPQEKRRSYEPAVRLTPEQKRHRANERAKLYRKENIQKIIQNNRLYRHRQRTGGTMPDRWEIMKMVCEQDARCIYCKELLPERFHIDHKMPVIRGGTNDRMNLQLLCGPCNSKKHTKTHEEYMQYLEQPI